MIRKILAINGGGILDVSFLTFMLKLSKHYDTKNIDILSLFDTFSGVSSGSILASAFALREQFLQNVATSSPDIIESALKKINPDYSDNDITKTIKNLKRMKIANCFHPLLFQHSSYFLKQKHLIFFIEPLFEKL